MMRDAMKNFTIANLPGAPAASAAVRAATGKSSRVGEELLPKPFAPPKPLAKVLEVEMAMETTASKVLDKAITAEKSVEKTVSAAVDKASTAEKAAEKTVSNLSHKVVDKASAAGSVVVAGIGSIASKVKR